MSIITISRGSSTGGSMLAEGLSRVLNYKLVRREDILQGTARFGVAAAKLEKFLFGPPTYSSDYKRDIRNYIAFFQAALYDYVQGQDVIYLGNVGHMMLKDVACVLRIRLIAPRLTRIGMLVERKQMTQEEAAAYIDKVDAQRRAWTLLLYGVDWLDPSLYDLTLNLESMNIDAAVDIAATAARHRKLAETERCVCALNDMALASRARAELAADPRTSLSDVEVEADAASSTIYLKGRVSPEVLDSISDVTHGIAQVQRVVTSDVERIGSGNE
jgi:cytidylate kinase